MSKRATTAWRAGLACGLLTPLIACGGESPEEAGPSPGEPAASSAGAAAAIASFHDDLIAPAAPEGGDETTVQRALSGDAGSAPKVFYLAYADGTKSPATDYDACSGKPAAPKFVCTFAPTLTECQQQIQAYLDKWYADFNLVFTLTRPTSGKYYTEVISSGGGAWCSVDAKVAGVAPFLCKDLQGGVAYTFQGGHSAKETAIIIAQEQAHLLGLEHTVSDRDVMHPTICTTCDGFENDDVAVTGDRCDRTTQNSYQMMKKALGTWAGGPKPSPFGCMKDSAPPTVKFLSPQAGPSKGHDFSLKVDVRDDCDVAKVMVSVMPEGLSAEAKSPPFEWDLTGLNGQQVITVMAMDHAGRSGTATLNIVAPVGRQQQDTTMSDSGCAVASSAFGVTGILPSAAMLLIFSGHHRRSRRRAVTGALSRSRPRATG